ncbi:TPA: hypothetical protein SL252_003584 [Pseudomonas aeruginosa]|nr:hypothetical protein [Pseudomonas aeruginosa]
MSSTQHQLIEQCATRLRGIVEALDNIHDTSPHRWSTDLDDVHSSAESLLAMIKDQAPPSEDQLIAAGLSYPLAKEDAVQLWYAGFRSEVVTVLEAWEAIGHDIGMNPSKGELLDSLRNMAAICNAHGNDMPAQSAIDQRQVIADAITGALAFGAQAQHSVPEVSGIGRDFAYPRSVVLYLRTEPTDDDLRAIHDGLRSLAAAPGKEVGHE